MNPTIDSPQGVAGCPALIRQILEQIDLVSGSDKWEAILESGTAYESP